MTTKAIAHEVSDPVTAALRPEADGVRAKLSLVFRRNTDSGATVLAGCDQRPPLRVVRAFSTEDGAALVHLHNVSGGLLGGDELEMRVNLGAGTAAQITTTGATRLYRPRLDARLTLQRNEIAIGTGALLEFVPDALIPYAGARFRQETSIRLEEGAGLFWWEIVAPGREASGEEFRYERVKWKTDVRVCGKLIASERVRLDPRQSPPSAPARFGDHRYCATFYICRAGMGAKFWGAAEERLREVAAEIDRGDGSRWGVSMLVSDGLIVRCVARDGYGILPGLRVLWSAAKGMLYGRAAVFPRKVN